MLRRVLLSMCVLVALAGLVLLSGCLVVSANPIYSHGEDNFTESILGDWENPNGDVVKFTRAVPAAKDYLITNTDSEGNMQYVFGVLADVDAHSYMDMIALTPEEVAKLPTLKPEQLRETLKGQDGTHFFYKIYISDTLLSFQMADPEWMYNYLQKNPNALEATMDKPAEDGGLGVGGGVSITDNTVDLRHFLDAHGHEMFMAATHLKRRQLDDLDDVDSELK